VQTRTSPTVTWADPAFESHRLARQAHWDAVARHINQLPDLSGSYHARLGQIYRTVVPPGLRVLELGCGQGDLLAELKPAFGVGVDLSNEMVRRARGRHRSLQFLQSDVHKLELRTNFDVVILSDLVNDLWDVQAVFEQIKGAVTPRSRVILNFYSRLWELPLDIARKAGLAKPLLPQNWLTVDDVTNLLQLAGFEVTRRWDEVLAPVGLRSVDRVANHYLAHIWPFTHLDLTHLIVARPWPEPARDEALVSVIVPARNEAGNIAAIFERTPEMGRGTELVFVEGHSNDETYAAIEREQARHPQRRVQLLRQTGKGKGDAVRLGFANACGDALMILDADLTVAPEDLPRFYSALHSGKSEFVNGVRLVYPMEKQAMRLLNLVGNKFFSLAFSWLLGQSIKDTLCGTKVLWRRDYDRIAAQRTYFGDFDPFGDFDLLFGAARLNLKIVDLPIRYRDRTYGTTNISRWRHGLLLLRMVVFAARRVKFV
jgi:SAM-dependent methyltransferase